MGKPQPSHFGLAGDVKCLRCGATNIPDNRICGRCGANLPLVYDEEGSVVRLEENSFRVTRSAKRSGAAKGPSVNRTRWMLRVLVILFALFTAAWFLAHKG
ncbi:MAG TPA: hypothetical protein VHE12_13235 [bacterium]|nr:hypothetical protein [bacterium]